MELRKVMRSAKGDNITVAQARRVFRQIKREEEKQWKAERRAKKASPVI
ncbi:MAG TPA: hypothetical protein VFJ82_04610 [Longimicrobium sp.]|nr:hypothetical protein [Longimicrobium sp.]